MWVSDVMTTNPITVSSNDKIFKVVKIFETNKIRSVLVVQSGKLVGIVTRSDIKNRIHENSDDVSKIMSKNVQTIHPNSDVNEAEYRINQIGINGLAVIYESKVVGIITRYDIQSHSEEIKPKHHPPSLSLKSVHHPATKTPKSTKQPYKRSNDSLIKKFITIVICIFIGVIILGIFTGLPHNPTFTPQSTSQYVQKVAFTDYHITPSSTNGSKGNDNCYSNRKSLGLFKHTPIPRVSTTPSINVPVFWKNVSMN